MVRLNEEQLQVLHSVQHKQSVFFTGPAGSGKSETLKSIVAFAYEHDLTVGVTATTGCAAFLIRGKTIHSFLGIGIAKGSAQELAAKAKKYHKNIVKRIQNLTYLVIDEISMMDADLFDKCSEYCAILRGTKGPFGGITLILSGDFCQLPPVQGKYMFHARAWNELNMQRVYLHRIYRQADEEFLGILSRARWGALTRTDLDRLQKCKFTEFSEDLRPTMVYAYRHQVDHLNQCEYEVLKNQCPTSEKRYINSVSGKGKHIQGLLEKYDIPQALALCPGAQVMVTWNVNADAGIVNGTRGKVIDLRDTSVILKTMHHSLIEIPFVEIAPDAHDDENTETKIKFMPLRLAYAMTVHRLQGSTLDCAQMDLGKSIFEVGQAYTALSRIKDLTSLKLTSIEPSSFRTHPDVHQFYNYTKE